jgi:hypothetical protein
VLCLQKDYFRFQSQKSCLEQLLVVREGGALPVFNVHLVQCSDASHQVALIETQKRIIFRTENLDDEPIADGVETHVTVAPYTFEYVGAATVYPTC